VKPRFGFNRVTFNRPFRLVGVPGVQSAGTYSVEVRDERTGWRNFLKSAVPSTWIRVNHGHGLGGKLTIHRVQANDLAEALRRDGGLTGNAIGRG
jgi:hypothetical protein